MSEQEKQGIAEAVVKAGESDVIIAVLGEDEYRTERAVRVLRLTCRDANSNYLRHCMQRKAGDTGADKRAAAHRQLGKCLYPSHLGVVVSRLSGGNGDCGDSVWRA